MLSNRTSRVLFCICLILVASGGAGSDRVWGHGAGLGTAYGLTREAAITDQSDAAADRPQEQAAPKKAYDLLTVLEQRQGVPLPGYVGGREFHNRERRLPRGHYREYDVNPRIRGKPRDAERIVIEQRTGRAYYTNDHYRTFIPLR